MQKSMPTKCPKCQQVTLYHNTGVSQKTNKPYENYKCAKCDYIQWIPQDETKTDRPSANKGPAPASAKDAIIADLLTELRTILLRLEKRFEQFLEISQLGSEQPYDEENPL